MRSTNFADALQYTQHRYGRCVDCDGRPVALVASMAGGGGRWGKDEVWRDSPEYVSEWRAMTEDGRELAIGEWVSTTDNDLRIFDGRALSLAGINCVPATPATADWYPLGAVYPDASGIYSSEGDCQASWDAAFATRKAAKQQAVAPVQQSYTLADLAKLSSKGKK